VTQGGVANQPVCTHGKMKTHDTLIPTRFMSTICFLVATIMVFSTMAENILMALPPNYSESSYRSNSTSFTFALVLTLISIGVNLLGFMLGFSMFMPAVCVLNIVSHTVGCIYTCVFIMQSWYESFPVTSLRNCCFYFKNTGLHKIVCTCVRICAFMPLCVRTYVCVYGCVFMYVCVFVCV